MAKEEVKTPTKPNALGKLRAIREQLAAENSAFAAASAVEAEAEAACKRIRDELRDRRKELKLGQEQLAAMLEMSQSAISKIEKSTGDLSYKTIFRVADALGLRPIVVWTSNDSNMVAEIVKQGSDAPGAVTALAEQDVMQALSGMVEQMVARRVAAVAVAAAQAVGGD